MLSFCIILAIDSEFLQHKAGYCANNRTDNSRNHKNNTLTPFRAYNGYTPANEEWLMETIMQYPDIKIVVDAKMDSTEGDAAVLARLEALESIYNYDISANILPEIFSKEMWDIAKETTTFDGYLFSHYKVYYSVGQILEYFDDPRIVGIALPSYTDNYIRSNIYKFKESKKIYVFTPLTKEEAADAASMGADGIYLNFPEIIS